ncbi:alpha/beta fold hydrolase [Paucibacter sp. XJ19-41]|uniref:alpha/beta fold hydrolase n=1 Tax=Paucibacter sp. XJ19-41 TaxID=2927824 RepID=UPI002349E19C|nr:alpha/beta hydrolase [Paucibacter sp. XJ19-41]MDC6168109.1 alpha/beta hydrolase [Paucibacter sp. XJ19-41]
MKTDPLDDSVSTLVLLPGMDGTGELFARFVRALPAELDVRIARYPLREPRAYAELEEQVLSMLPTDRPYGLLAESFSGPIGIRIAARAPKGLRRLLLCCSFARNPRPTLAPLQMLLPLLPLSRLPRSMLGRVLMGEHHDPTLQTELDAAMDQVSPEVLRARLLAVIDVDVLAQLTQIAVPMLYMQAASDRLVPRTAADLLLAHRPDIRKVQLAGPHFLLQTQPAAAAREVLRFLAVPPSR